MLLIVTTLLTFSQAFAKCVSVDLLAEDVECDSNGCASPLKAAESFAVQLDVKGRGTLEQSQLINGVKRVTLVHLKKFEESFKIDIENYYVGPTENFNMSSKRNLVDDLTRFDVFRMTGEPTSIKEKTYQTIIELSPGSTNKCGRN